MERFKVVNEGYNSKIMDAKDNINLFFLAESGMGQHSKITELAETVCSFLNKEHNDWKGIFNQ